MLSINAYVLIANFGIDDHLNTVVGYKKSREKGFRGKTVNTETILQAMCVNSLMLYGWWMITIITKFSVKEGNKWCEL